MARKSLKEKISEGLFLLDGAMGTQLIARGIDAVKCSDWLNIERPEVVTVVHRAYLQAGSDAVLTNTFGANRYSLGRHGLGDKVKEINTAGAQIARQAAGEEKYVLGDIGPSGDFLEPVGNLKAEELKEAFCEQVKGLLAGGVDGFIIETMTAIDEAKIATEAVKSVGGDLPVFVSMSFDEVGDDFKTMMGVGVERAVSEIAGLGVDAIGFNCGKVSLDGYIKLACKYIEAVKALGLDIAVLAEPNAGMPELVEGKAVYKVEPEEYAATVEKIHSAGVRILGGCCGTDPEHIEAMAKKLR